MKKGLLIAGLALFGAAAQAQDLKPVAGDITTEFGLTGGINRTNFKLNDGAGMLRFRYFQKENLAFRLGFNVESKNDKTNVFGMGPSAGKKGTITESATNVLINLGVEKHFAGTNRLSPYVGADLLFGTGSSKIKSEDATFSGNAATGVFQENTFITAKAPGYTSIGLRGVIGADYYIAKRLFLGVEAGLGFAYEKEGKSETTTSFGGNNSTTVKHKSAGSTTTISPSVITGLRVGFAF